MEFTVSFDKKSVFRGGSRTAATSKMDHFVIIVNGWKPLTIITKRSILNIAVALDPPLLLTHFLRMFRFFTSWKRLKAYGFLKFLGSIETGLRMG